MNVCNECQSRRKERPAKGSYHCVDCDQRLCWSCKRHCKHETHKVLNVSVRDRTEWQDRQRNDTGYESTRYDDSSYTSNVDHYSDADNLSISLPENLSVLMPDSSQSTSADQSINAPKLKQSRTTKLSIPVDSVSSRTAFQVGEVDTSSTSPSLPEDLSELMFDRLGPTKSTSHNPKGTTPHNPKGTTSTSEPSTSNRLSSGGICRSAAPDKKTAIKNAIQQGRRRRKPQSCDGSSTGSVEGRGRPTVAVNPLKDPSLDNALPPEPVEKASFKAANWFSTKNLSVLFLLVMQIFNWSQLFDLELSLMLLYPLILAVCLWFQPAHVTKRVMALTSKILPRHLTVHITSNLTTLFWSMSLFLLVHIVNNQKSPQVRLFFFVINLVTTAMLLWQYSGKDNQKAANMAPSIGQGQTVSFLRPHICLSMFLFVTWPFLGSYWYLQKLTVAATATLYHRLQDQVPCFFHSMIFMLLLSGLETLGMPLLCLYIISCTLFYEPMLAANLADFPAMSSMGIQIMQLFFNGLLLLLVRGSLAVLMLVIYGLSAFMSELVSGWRELEPQRFLLDSFCEASSVIAWMRMTVCMSHRIGELLLKEYPDMQILQDTAAKKFFDTVIVESVCLDPSTYDLWVALHMQTNIWLLIIDEVAAHTQVTTGESMPTAQHRDTCSVLPAVNRESHQPGQRSRQESLPPLRDSSQPRPSRKHRRRAKQRKHE